MRQVLDEEFSKFYPLAVDTTDGGFFSDIDYKWQLVGPQYKMDVTQARHAWASAHAAMFYQQDNMLHSIAAHGVEFLRRKMWDPEYGGFYSFVDRKGEPLKENGKIVKRAYGNAFAVYGLAMCRRAAVDPAALGSAQEAFRWLDKHSYDPEYGGYFQFMERDGTPMKEGYRGIPPKDQNSMMHILECLTELYKVWPDQVVAERLRSLLLLIRDKVTTDMGNLVLFFNPDLTPISYRDSDAAVRERNYEFDHLSFGHDVETAYLMLEASEALGIKNDAKTLMVGKKMVDHAIRNGWDHERGGIHDRGYCFKGEERPRIIRKTKEWWSQVEALNSFLLMSESFPNDELRYHEKFCEQWEYCKRYLIDPEHGGFYYGGTDIVPDNKFSPKATIWKCNYHTSRALINCIKRIEKRDTAGGLGMITPG